MGLPPLRPTNELPLTRSCCRYDWKLNLPTSETNTDQRPGGVWKTGQMPFDKLFTLDSAT